MPHSPSLSFFLSLLFLSLSHNIKKVYEFSKSGNAEIRFRFCMLGLKAQPGLEEVVPSALKLATEQGRMKFTRPLYRELFKTEFGKQKAVDTFNQHIDFYHPICKKMVSRDLGL